MKINKKILLIITVIVSLLISHGIWQSMIPELEASIQGDDVKFPWNFGGFTKEKQLHLKYFYVSRDVFETLESPKGDWKEFTEGKTVIVEIWFKQDGGLMRLDRYIEQESADCATFTGTPPEPITYEGGTYILKERIIQKGLTKSQLKIRRGSNKSCEYERTAHNINIEMNQDQAVGSMTHGETVQPDFWFFYHNSDMSRQLQASNVAMLEIMKKAEYKALLDGWKQTESIAGRTGVKNTGSAPWFGGKNGFEFIDTKLGLGLKGFLKGIRDLSSGRTVEFPSPVLVYQALIVETAVSDDVFDIQ